MSYDPHVFGPPTWIHMHIMAATATSDRKRELYVQWLNGLTETLPCEKCRLHLIENMKAMPVEPYANNNVSLFFHSWKLHDTVNKQTYKAKNLQMTYDEAFEKYFGKPKPMMGQADDSESSSSPISQTPAIEYDERYVKTSNNNNYSNTYNYHNNNSNHQNNNESSTALVMRSSIKPINGNNRNNNNSSNNDKLVSGENCNQDCGHVKVEINPPKDFEAFRIQQRRFFTKNT